MTFCIRNYMYICSSHLKSFVMKKRVLKGVYDDSKLRNILNEVKLNPACLATVTRYIHFK